MTKKIYAIDIIHTKNIRSRWTIPLVINKIKRQSLPDYKWCQHTIQRRNEKDSEKGSPSLPIKKRTRSKIFHTSINFIRMTVTKAEADSSICATAKKKKIMRAICPDPLQMKTTFCMNNSTCSKSKEISVYIWSAYKDVYCSKIYETTWVSVSRRLDEWIIPNPPSRILTRENVYNMT